MYGMGIIMGIGVIEERGRVVVPKNIRDEIKLKPGQKVIIERSGNSIIIRPAVEFKKFSSELKGCVKKSKIKPMDIKNIWHM